jgi:hypothetical protein
MEGAPSSMPCQAAAWAAFFVALDRWLSDYNFT